MGTYVRNLTDFDDWKKEMSEFDKDSFKNLDENYNSCVTKMDEFHKAQDKLSVHVQTVSKSLPSYEYSLKKIYRSKKIDKNQYEKAKTNIDNFKKKIEDVSVALSKSPSWFLRQCIGNINVSLYWKKLDYKNQYELFKNKITALSLLFAIINLIFFPSNRIADIIYMTFLVWYYSSLTLQENILVANGSKIKGWWLTHHYVSIIITCILLIFPQSQFYDYFKQTLYFYYIYQCFIQFMLNYYQSGVLYKMRALGTTHTMDVTTDCFRPYMIMNLSFLVPFLIMAYIFQAYCSYIFYSFSKKQNMNSWLLSLLSFLFAMMSFFNLATLIQVVIQKKISQKSFKQTN